MCLDCETCGLLIKEAQINEVWLYKLVMATVVLIVIERIHVENICIASSIVLSVAYFWNFWLQLNGKSWYQIPRIHVRFLLQRKPSVSFAVGFLNSFHWLDKLRSLSLTDHEPKLWLSAHVSLGQFLHTRNFQFLKMFHLVSQGYYR